MFGAPSRLACELAAAHLAGLTAAANGMDCEFYTAISAAPRFLAVSAAAVRGTGWSWADLAAEEAAEEAAALSPAAAAAEGNRLAAAAAAAKADEAATRRREDDKSKDESDEGGEGKRAPVRARRRDPHRSQVIRSVPPRRHREHLRDGAHPARLGRSSAVGSRSSRRRGGARRSFASSSLTGTR